MKPIGKRDKPDEPDQPVSEEVAEKRDEPQKFTAVQLKISPEVQEDAAEQPEDDPGSRRAGIIAAAAGALVLCALGAGIELLGFAAPDSVSTAAHFAEDNAEIFAEVSAAYTARKLGGENVQPQPGREQVFGELLLDPGEQLGTYSFGTTLCTAQADSITVYSADADGVSVTAEVLPPEGAKFLTVHLTENGIAAVFSGEDSCGITGIDSSGQSFVAQQSGALTEYFCDGGVIRLGSVYTPVYTRSFGADDTGEYLPAVGLNGASAAFEPSDIVLNGAAQGISFAVWAEYSAASGEVTGQKAALGDPVFSGAERFTAALLRENGSLLIAADEQGNVLCEEIGETSAAACGGGIIATAEQTEDGCAVFLRGADLQTVSAFSTGSEITALRISDGVIRVEDGDKTVMAADIGDPDVPVPLELVAAQGVVSGEYALCGGRNSSGITLTLYRLSEGKAVQTDTFAKSLTKTELETLQFCGMNTTVINGAELCGAAYRWFDGVSVVDEFAQLGKSRSIKTLYDDKNGFTAAAVVDGELKLICGDKLLG